MHYTIFMIKIGSHTLSNPLVAAPLAGISNSAYRRIMHAFGIGLVVTEMTSAKAITYGNQKTLKMLEITPDEGLVSLQLFGAEKAALVEAVRVVNDHSNASVIDLNAGCPVPKVVDSDAGAALLKDPEKAYALLSAMVQASNKPVTVKIRTGWNDALMTGVEMAQLAEKAGVAMIAVHGRTRAQKYLGNASLDAIKHIKEAVSLPVLGNGDVKTPEDAAEMLEVTGVDGVMIGRGLLGNPWLISQTLDYLQTGTYDPCVSVADRFRVLRQHATYLEALKGEKIAVLEMRAQASHYVKELPHASAFRKGLMPLQSMARVHAHIDDYEADLTRRL